MSFATFIGYPVSAFIGKAMESNGMIFNDAPIHTMWIVWLVSYVIIILLGLAWDFVLKIKSKKSISNYIGLSVIIVAIIIIIFSYITKII